jgi:hypothetical protein
MNKFSVIYKKVFKQLLYPHGYTLWKRVFYKEMSDSICLFIYAEKATHSNLFEVYIDIVPYCLDLKTAEYEPEDEGISIADFYKVFLSENPSPEFLIKRFAAINDEVIQSSLNYLCQDMESLILPYIHKFTDLNYCYDELIKLFKADGCKNLDSCLRQDVLYWLSIKLHKYENAIPFVNYKLSYLYDVIKNTNNILSELKKGNIAESLNVSFNSEQQALLVSAILKKRPDYMVSQTQACEREINNSKSEIEQMNTIKNALQSNDYVYLDRLVEETEKNSREYLQRLLVNR